ncbi:MAG: thioredoxin [Betaproteobacteria bacterium]|nr:MAG: thioredoxin [Betaproteobacteria bacterium]
MAAHSIDVGAENFQEVVVEGSKRAPVIIDFWAPWCGPCRALKPVLEKLADEYAGRFTLAKINSDENQDIAASLGVRSIPAVKAVVDGKLVDEFVGALPESQVRAFIERVLPSPADLALKEAELLIAAGHAGQALALLDAALGSEPRNEPAKIARLEALLLLDRLDEARSALADLSPLSLDDARVAALKARLEFADQVSEDPTELTRRIESNPGDLDARLQLARCYVHSQAYEAALEQLIEIVRADRSFGDDIGRKTMVEVFNLLGGQGELVGKYRRLLSAALY